jgi:hypothetical protein
MILSPTAKPAAAPAPKESEAPKETEEVRA